MSESLTVYVIKAILAVILFAAWFYITYHPTANDSAMLMFIQLSLGAITGHTVKSTNPPESKGAIT